MIAIILFWLTLLVTFCLSLTVVVKHENGEKRVKDIKKWKAMLGLVIFMGLTGLYTTGIVEMLLSRRY